MNVNLLYLIVLYFLTHRDYMIHVPLNLNGIGTGDYK